LAPNLGGCSKSDIGGKKSYVIMVIVMKPSQEGPTQTEQNWTYSKEPGDVLARRALWQSEESVYPQPEITPELAEERKRINEECFNGGTIAPESLIRRAIESPIDFIDLYAYHSAALNHRAEEFHKTNPLAKVVHVGLEFSRSIQTKGFPDKNRVVHFNEFLINYETLAFLKRLQPDSVGFINIDFPDLRERKTLVLEEARRVLKKGGQISFYVEIDLTQNIIHKLESLGFSSSKTMDIEEGDFLRRRPREHNEKQIIRILATK